MPGIGSVRKLLLLVAALAAALVVTVAGVALAKPARDTSGVVYAGVTHVEGSDVYVAGDFKDEILGRGAIVYITQVQTGPEVGTVLIESKKITLYTKRGSLSGSGQATQTIYADGNGAVTDGTFKLTKGTGKLKGHKLKGTFEGPFEDGVYTFDYTGT